MKLMKFREMTVFPRFSGLEAGRLERKECQQGVNRPRSFMVCSRQLKAARPASPSGYQFYFKHTHNNSTHKLPKSYTNTSENSKKAALNQPTEVRLLWAQTLRNVLHLFRQLKSLHNTTQFCGDRSSKTWSCIKTASHSSAEKTSHGTERCTPEEFKLATSGKQ